MKGQPTLLPALLLISVASSACGAWSAGCGPDSLRPATYDSSYACANCRMSVSDVHFAGQIVAPGEEPRFYDDIGCLASALARPLPERAVAFVADHRTGVWVSAEAAVFTRVETLSTPMGSHLVAHVDAASRDQDKDVKGGVPVTADEALGRSGAPR